MIDSFFAMFFVVLLMRLLVMKSSQPLSWHECVIKSGVEVLAVILLIEARPGVAAQYILALGLLPAINIVTVLLEPRAERLPPGRLVSLAVTVVVLGILFSDELELQIYPGLRDTVLSWGDGFLPLAVLARYPWLTICIVGTGLLLCLRETSYVIRLLINSLRLRPELAEPDCEADDEPGRGRLIGMLERVFVFGFVLSGQYVALGFVLAAKGFARFRKMDDRDFAEYVLIGTLASMVAASAVALGVRAILQGP
ncbi:MAG: hypothetical protein ACOC93_02930 [Planctomycetota bacterium]